MLPNAAATNIPSLIAKVVPANTYDANLINARRPFSF